MAWRFVVRLIGVAAGVGAVGLLGGVIGWAIGIVAVWSNGILLNFSFDEIERDQAPRLAMVVAPIATVAALVTSVVGVVV